MDNISRGDADRRTRPYNLTLIKEPPAERRKFRALTRPETYFEIRAARVGELAAYRVEMTAEEYGQARRDAEDPASNLISVNPDYVCTADAPAVPGQAELRYLAAHGAFDRGIRGQGVRVAVADSGVTGSLFSGRIGASKSFVSQNPLVDNDGHGTRMASLAVPPQASLLVAQMASGGGALTSNMAAAIYWATDEVDADVISMSYSGSGTDAALEAAVRHAFDSDVIFFCSMGNHGTNEAYQPARFYQAHAIANFDSGTDSPDTFTAYGPHVFLASTGSPVTWYNRDGSQETADGGGSSAATALAAHVSALLLSRGYSKGNVLRYMLKHARRTGASPNAEGAGVIQADLVEKKIREDRPRKRRLKSGGNSGGDPVDALLGTEEYALDTAGKIPKDGCV